MNHIPDTHTDLLDGPIAIATVDERGYPQVTAITAKLDEQGRVHASVLTTRRKYANMVATPQATLFAIDRTGARRTLEVRADVELLADPGKAWTQEFVGPDFDIDAFDPPGSERAHVVLTPVRVNVLG